MSEHLELNDLISRLSDPSHIREHRFSLLRDISYYVNTLEDSEIAHELVLRALENKDSFGSMSEILDALVRKIGLFPYLKPENLHVKDLLAYEAHRPFSMNRENDNYVFHRLQGLVYRRLMGGENIILSAPTSFGKSLIIDAVIASGEFSNIVIVVPTIALIDETRKRLSKYLDRYKIITHPSQAKGDQNIFILTQERVLEINDLSDVKFFIIDEFYKLDPTTDSAESDRSILLNQAFYRLHKTGARFYLLGPHINGIPDNFQEQYNCKFIYTDYSTTISEVEQLDHTNDKTQQLIGLCRSLNESTIIYCSSPAK
jgi:replicative superfamily II helicase